MRLHGYDIDDITLYDDEIVAGFDSSAYTDINRVYPKDIPTPKKTSTVHTDALIEPLIDIIYSTLNGISTEGSINTDLKIEVYLTAVRYLFSQSLKRTTFSAVRANVAIPYIKYSLPKFSKVSRTLSAMAYYNTVFKQENASNIAADLRRKISPAIDPSVFIDFKKRVNATKTLLKAGSLDVNTAVNSILRSKFITAVLPDYPVVAQDNYIAEITDQQRMPHDLADAILMNLEPKYIVKKTWKNVITIDSVDEFLETNSVFDDYYLLTQIERTNHGGQ